MNTRSRLLRGLASSLLLPLVAGAGCLAQPEADEGQSEDLGATEQAITYAGVNPQCKLAESHTYQSPGHVPDSCAAGVGYTFNDALAVCGAAGVKYYKYGCTDISWGAQPVAHAWTAYMGCCTLKCTSPGIFFETRHFAPGSTPPKNTLEAVSIFNQLTPGGMGYGVNTTLQDTESFSNHRSIPSALMPFGYDHDIAYHLKASIVINDAGAAKTWGFRLGMDYGLGGVLLVDGNPIDSVWWDNIQPVTAATDPHWKGVWGGVPQVGVLQGSAELGIGVHTIETYGFENGFDSGHGAQMRLEFRAPGAQWSTISTQVIRLCGQ